MIAPSPFNRRRAGLVVVWGAALALALPGRATAQNAGSILGRVVDAITGEPRAGALLSVEGTDLRTSSAAGNGRSGGSGDGGPATEARLRAPRGLAVARGRLYIADAADHRVRVVDLDTGVIETVAGTGAQGFAGNGGSDYNGSGLEAGETSLPAPAGLASDLGFLFISDDRLDLVWRTPIRF